MVGYQRVLGVGMSVPGYLGCAVFLVQDCMCSATWKLSNSNLPQSSNAGDVT